MTKAVYVRRTAAERRRISQMFAFDNTGARKRIVKGYIYDGGGARRQFFPGVLGFSPGIALNPNTALPLGIISQLDVTFTAAQFEDDEYHILGVGGMSTASYIAATGGENLPLAPVPWHNGVLGAILCNGEVHYGAGVTLDVGNCSSDPGQGAFSTFYLTVNGNTTSWPAMSATQYAFSGANARWRWASATISIGNTVRAKFFP